jgi:hypothetical protein
MLPQDLSMLNSVDYASLFQYSPRGVSDTCKKSRSLKDAIKAGRIESYRQLISEIISKNQQQLAVFLNEEVSLVPAPRSSPLPENALWPALEICKVLSSLNLGSIGTCLMRKEAIRKSSFFFKADERPSISEQYDSMVVKPYMPTTNITLVDDVITLGRTSIAGASRLSEKFPNATIRVFALLLTMGFVPTIDTIIEVRFGTITYNYRTDKCSREP